MTSTIGNWDEQGLLNSFKKKGITYFSAISEYLANSVDARATVITLILEKDFFTVVDNGNGMNREQITHMFSNYRSNHAEDRSIGSVGIGAKLGNAFISKYQYTSTVFTKSAKGEYLKVTIPWGEIYDSGVYQSKIMLDTMIEEEIEEFHTILQNNNPGKVYTGTVIKHKFDPSDDIVLQMTINTQFDIKKLQHSFHEKKKRWDCMFLDSNLDIYLINKIENPDAKYKLARYHHLKPDLNYYFDGIQEYEIRILKDPENNLLFLADSEGDTYVIPKKAKGYSKTPEKYVARKYSHYTDTHQRITYQIGAEVNPDYFDPNEPQNYTLKNLSQSEMSPYDKKFFGTSKDQRIDCSKTSILRNGQQISSINLPEFKFSQQDGGSGTEEKTFGIVITTDLISYYTLSNQDNISDEVFGIQEIKDNVEENKICINFLRLLSYLREKYTKSNFKKIKDMIPSEEATPDPTVRLKYYSDKIKKLKNKMKVEEILDEETEALFLQLITKIF